MRLVKITVPEGRGREVAELALQSGIEQASVHQVYVYGPDQTKDVVDCETSTPKARKLIESVMTASFFDPQECSINVRQPRSIISRESPLGLTAPLLAPTIDVYEELWQFSQLTVSFILRTLIAALLLSYGMIKYNLLLMIAGLLFMPLLPTLLAISFGVWTQEWRLVKQGAVALVTGLLLAFVGGVIVALLSSPPLRYQEFNSFGVSLAISACVGVAAGLSTLDDVGRRELIGLAATAQITILPVWLGSSLILGFPVLDQTLPAQRGLLLVLNLVTIMAAALATYALLGTRAEGIARYARQLFQPARAERSGGQRLASTER